MTQYASISGADE